MSLKLCLTPYGRYKLRVFEDGVLRKTRGSKRDEVTRGWRKFHTEELHTLYSSPDIVRTMRPERMREAGHVARTGD
jgi:hypothetical protein